MSAELQWFVTQNGQSFGPYTGGQLVEFSTAGNITRDTMIWSEGMPDWLPAGQIHGLFPHASAAQPAPAATTQPAPSAGQDTTRATPTTSSPEMDAPYPHVGIKAANFALWLGLFLGGVTLVLVGVLILGSSATSTAHEISNGTDIPNVEAGKMGVAGLVIFSGALVNLASAIPMYLYLYRAWSCLKPGKLARTTPGAAVGLMFIPFFHLYWIFQAFLGLAKDWNQTMARHSDLKSAPRMPEGVFLAFCIGCFVPPLAFVMIFPVMSRICNGINFFAFRPKSGQYSAFSKRPGGTLLR